MNVCLCCTYRGAQLKCVKTVVLTTPGAVAATMLDWHAPSSHHLVYYDGLIPDTFGSQSGGRRLWHHVRLDSPSLAD